jgi:uncharacterized peroxidase-related enzyme
MSDLQGVGGERPRPEQEWRDAAMKNAFVRHEIDTAPEASRPMLQAVKDGWGFVPNLHKTLAESPVALEAYGALWGLVEKTAFSPIERNVAYLAIIYENECEYCMAGHSGLSKMAGVRADHIAAVREGRPIEDPKLEALRRFAGLIARDRGVVAKAEVAAFKAAGFTNAHVLDLLVVAATKLISNYANHLAGTPNDAFMAGSEWTAPGKLKSAA